MNATDASRPPPTRRGDYPHHLAITSRWLDNDAYGHVNNAVYFQYFDTVVNTFLVEAGVLDVREGPVMGWVVDVRCQYFASLAYPDTITAGLRVARVGRSSVTYEIGIFGAGSDSAAAQGHFVHVYVDRATQRPTAIPEALARALLGLTREGA